LGDGGSDAIEGAFLSTRRSLGLDGHVNFGNFVEQEGGLVGEFKAAFAELLRAGEGAFFVAKEFGLQEIGGQGRAVQRDHGRPLRARAEVSVNPLGDDFLAGAGFAGDQDGSIMRGGDLIKYGL